MINRIVCMSFDPSKTAEFVKIFNESKELIAASQGCLSLSLMQDTNDLNVFFTFSKWESENDLNAYRKSDVFVSIWRRTKVLFNERPMAWSVNTLQDVK
jgi:quinol monooxygenase YgiN